MCVMIFSLYWNMKTWDIARRVSVFGHLQIVQHRKKIKMKQQASQAKFTMLTTFLQVGMAKNIFSLVQIISASYEFPIIRPAHIYSWQSSCHAVA